MKIFDLEQQIMQCWDVVTDLELIQGETANALRHIYQLKFEKLFQTFEEVCADYHASRREVVPLSKTLKDTPRFPGNWVVLRWSSGAYKLLVGWDDGLGGDESQLSSNITRVEKDGDGFLFHDQIGDQYFVFPEHYGFCAASQEWYETFQTQVAFQPASTNWLEMDWNAHVGQPWLRTYDGTQE